MPKTPNLHSYVYLVMSVLYMMECVGFEKSIVGAGLAICYYLLYRF